MNTPNTSPEYSYLTCCFCEQEIKPDEWYATIDDDHKAHSSCWQKNKASGHSQRPVPSRFRFLDKKMPRLALMNNDNGCEILSFA